MQFCRAWVPHYLPSEDRSHAPLCVPLPFRLGRRPGDHFRTREKVYMYGRFDLLPLCKLITFLTVLMYNRTFYFTYPFHLTTVALGQINGQSSLLKRNKADGHQGSTTFQTPPQVPIERSTVEYRTACRRACIMSHNPLKSNLKSPSDWNCDSLTQKAEDFESSSQLCQVVFQHLPSPLPPP